MTRPRTAFVSNCPLPYHTPILNELARLVELHVIYMSRRHPLEDSSSGRPLFDNQWGTEPHFEYSFHWSRALKLPSHDFRAQFSIGVGRRLSRLRPEVIVFSSWGPLMVEPLAWKIVAKRKAVMWAESSSFSGLLRGTLPDAFRRLLVSRVDAFVTNGSKASEYLFELGARQDRVITSCLPSVPEGPVLWETRSGKDGPRYLFVGRLILRKRPAMVLQAFERILVRYPDATLTVVGDGPLSDETATNATRLGRHVRMLGRVEGPKLQAIFSQHDVLVLPALREVWGLVVNEALAHGLFVVVSDQVGSAFDLVDRSNGRIFPADDLDALVTALWEAGEMPQDAESRRRRALSVASCTASAFAKDVVRAAQLVRGAQPSIG